MRLRTRHYWPAVRLDGLGPHHFKRSVLASQYRFLNTFRQLERCFWALRSCCTKANSTFPGNDSVTGKGRAVISQTLGRSSLPCAGIFASNYKMRTPLRFTFLLSACILGKEPSAGTPKVVVTPKSSTAYHSETYANPFGTRFAVCFPQRPGSPHEVCYGLRRRSVWGIRGA